MPFEKSQSNTEMEKGINHKDHAPEESKLATSSLVGSLHSSFILN